LFGGRFNGAEMFGAMADDMDAPTGHLAEDHASRYYRALMRTR
jgi:hypothetical protein